MIGSPRGKDRQILGKSMNRHLVFSLPGGATPSMLLSPTTKNMVTCNVSAQGNLLQTQNPRFLLRAFHRHSAFHVPKSQTPRRKESVHHKLYLLYKPSGHPFNQEAVQVSSFQMLTKSQTYQRVLLNNSLKPAILTLFCTGIMFFQVQII